MRRLDRPVGRMLGAIVGMSLALFGGVAISGWILGTGPGEYDPLGEYPVQTVSNRLPEVSGPAARVGEPLNVTGIKCNDTDAPVDVQGVFRWALIQPAGLQVIAGEGTGERIPGCDEGTFENEWPPEFEQRVRRTLARTGEPVVIALRGVETPIAVDDRVPVPREWQTENVTILED